MDGGWSRNDWIVSFIWEDILRLVRSTHRILSRSIRLTVPDGLLMDLTFLHVHHLIYSE